MKEHNLIALNIYMGFLWIKNSDIMIVSGVLCKRLCLYAQEIKMKNVVLFQ